MPGQIDEEVKEWRANTLMEIQRSVSNEASGKFIGQILDVLIERYDGRSDIFIGRSQYDAPEIDGEVYVSNCSAEIGEISKVRITHAYEYDLSGEGVL
ncbi:Ribosomal protein S12 methylthiotransferase RimO [compost metagenome]